MNLIASDMKNLKMTFIDKKKLISQGIPALFFLTSLLLLFAKPVLAQEQPAAAPPAARPVSRMPMMIKSGEVMPENKIMFRLYAPKATTVAVTGEWMKGFGASEIMTRNDTGLFTLETGPLPAELYGYSFIVDGISMPDPANVQMRRDGSRYQSFIIVPGKESDLYFQKTDVPHGTIAKIWYDSPVLGLKRRMYVYTPAGYEENNVKYPVFYLLHGAGGDEDAWTTMGRAAQIMDNLIAQGKAVPMIVVMTNGNANQEGAQNDVPPVVVDPQQGMETYMRLAGKFEESLVKDVVPFIEKKFRAYTDAGHRAIAGLSMGGAHTQTITFNNPGMFDYIGVYSMGLMSGFGRQQTPDEAAKAEQERDQKIEALKESGYRLYWIGCGKDDFVYQSVINLRNALDKHNFKYVYRESTGGHTWANWRIYLSEFAPMLFK
jgi:enterochelin esterase family protein